MTDEEYLQGLVKVKAVAGQTPHLCAMIEGLSKMIPLGQIRQKALDRLPPVRLQLQGKQGPQDPHHQLSLRSIVNGNEREIKAALPRVRRIRVQRLGLLEDSKASSAVLLIV